MIFVDSNIPMFLIGAEHPLKGRAADLIGDIVRQRRKLVTSAEVLQEICHRYTALKRLEFIQPAFDIVRGLVDQIFPVTENDVEASKTLLLGYPKLAARDALHLATMRELGITKIISFDSDFDRFPWIERLF